MNNSKLGVRRFLKDCITDVVKLSRFQYLTYGNVDNMWRLVKMLANAILKVDMSYSFYIRTQC